MDYDYDVIYIGSGNAAWQGGRFLTDAGWKVLIIEEGLYGGACANYGCNSKILLDAPYELKSAIERYEGIGKKGDFSVDWPSLMEYKRVRIAGLSTFLDGKFKEYGIDVADGKGFIVDEHTVGVGDKTYTTERIVIATGLSPVIPDIPGKEYIHDSTDFLDVSELPEHAIIMGAGFVGMEFASILCEAGKEVDLLVRSEICLRHFYQPYVELAITELESKGVRFHYNQSPASIEKDGEDFIVTTQDGSTFTGDYVIGAMGREANVKDIGLDKVGLEYTASGIPVDGNMRTKVDNIFATGDVADTGQAKLVTVAIHQSKYLAKYLLGQTDEEITYPVVPAVVFTLPRIATVGIPVYKALNMDGYNIHRIRYGDSYSIELKNDRTAEVTVVTDSDMNIVGAELYGPEAENMANIFAFIINKNISLEELDYFIYAFPSSISVMLYKMHNIHYKIGDRKE